MQQQGLMQHCLQYKPSPQELKQVKSTHTAAFCISWGSQTVWAGEQTGNLLKPGVNTCFNLGLNKNGFSHVFCH